MLIRIARFIREKYSYLIVTALIVGAIIGFYTSSPGRFIKNYTSILTIIMIWAMSFTIRIEDFPFALKNFNSFLTGVLFNFVLAPFLCWVLASIILHSYPNLAIGMILIGVIPCAGMAMVWTSMLKGNMPLSIVINASTMVLAPFLIPALMKVLTGSYVHINMRKMFEDLMVTLLFPVATGIASRWIVEHATLKSHEKIRHYLDIFSSISAVMAMLLMFMTINTSVQMILKHLALLIPLVASTALVFPIMFGTAYLLSKKLFDYDSNIAITYSSGMKNLPIAMSIAITSFKEISALPIAVGFIFQMITAVGFYRIFRRLDSRDREIYKEKIVIGKEE